MIRWAHSLTVLKCWEGVLVTDLKSDGNQTPCGPTPASKLTTNQGLPGNETRFPDTLQLIHTNHGTLHRRALREATQGQWGAEERQFLIYRRVVEATLPWKPLFFLPQPAWNPCSVSETKGERVRKSEWCDADRSTYWPRDGRHSLESEG